MQVLDPARVHRHVLANGLTVLVRRDATAPVAAVVTYVKAGYFDETDDVAGIAHVLEHMFFKGTERRGVGDIAKETKGVGGYLNASTIYDHTRYYAVLPSSGFEAGLEIQADAYANSVIDAGELARELEVIIEEAKRKADSPPAVATESLYALLHDRHRIRRWRIGREPGLRALNRDALLHFYRNFYKPSATILCIVGDVDVEYTLGTVERLYGSLRDGGVERFPGERETAPSGFRYQELSGDIAETQLAFGWRTVDALHPDAPLLDIAASVLSTGRSSRLYRAVRERQLVSSASAYHYTPTELGIFVISAEGRPERSREALRAIWGEVDGMRRDGVEIGELARIRRITEARWLRRIETMEGQANHLADWEALGDWKMADVYYQRVQTATPDEVTRAVRQHLTDENVAVLTYRPATSPVLAADAGEARALLYDVRGIATPTIDDARIVTSPVIARRFTSEHEEAGVCVYRTRGGLPVLVRSRPGSPMLYLGVVSVGGAWTEPEDKGGVVMLAARGAIKGTTTRGAVQLANELELLGATVGASVTTESVEWTLSSPASRGREAALLLADVVQHATYPDDAMESERAVAISNLASMRDDMYQYPRQLMLQAAYGAHPYGRSALGTESSLRALTPDDVRAWHSAHVLRGTLAIGVVGGGDPDELAAMIADAFGELEWREGAPIAPPRWPNGVEERAEQRDKAQTALLMGFPGPARNDDRRYAAMLLAGITSGLGGRFFDELRDRQSLAYTVQTAALQRRAAGMFTAYIATSPVREETARAGLLAEFAKLRETPVSAEELERARVYALGMHDIAGQSGSALLGRMLDAWTVGGGLHELARWRELVSAVTPEEILDLARDSFDPERRVEGVVRGTLHSHSGVG